MTWILESIIMFFLSLIGRILDVFNLLFLNIMGIDGEQTMDVFQSVLAINIDGVQKVFQALAIFLIFLIAMWEILKIFYKPIEEIEPMPTFCCKIFAYGVLVFCGDWIVQMIIDLGTIPFKLFNDPNASELYSHVSDPSGVVGTDGLISNIAGTTVQGAYTGLVYSLPAGSALSVLSGIEIVIAMILIVLIFIMLFEYLKLLLEYVERYVLLCCMQIFAPLAFACGVSKSTYRIMRSYVRIIISQVILMSMGIFFINVFIASLKHIFYTTGATGGMKVSLFISFLILISWLTIGQKIDQHMSTLGLDVAQSGKGLGLALLGSMNLAKPFVNQMKEGAGMGGYISKTARGGGSPLASATQAFSKLTRGDIPINSSKDGLVGKMVNGFNNSKYMQSRSGLNSQVTESGLNHWMNNGKSDKKMGSQAIAISKTDLAKNGLASALQEKGVEIKNGVVATDGLGNFKSSMECQIGDKAFNLETSNNPFSDIENGVGYEITNDDGSTSYYRFSGNGMAAVNGLNSTTLEDGNMVDNVNNVLSSKDMNTDSSVVLNNAGEELNISSFENTPFAMDSNGNVSLASGWSVDKIADYEQDGVQQGSFVQVSNADTGEMSTFAITPQGVSESSIVGADNQFSIDGYNSNGALVSGKEISTFKGMSIDDLQNKQSISEYNGGSAMDKIAIASSNYVPNSTNNNASVEAIQKGFFQTQGLSGEQIPINARIAKECFNSNKLNPAIYDARTEKLICDDKYHEAIKEIKDGKYSNYNVQLRDKNAFGGGNSPYCLYDKGKKEAPAFQTKFDIEKVKSMYDGKVLECSFRNSNVQHTYIDKRMINKELAEKALGTSDNYYVFNGSMSKYIKKRIVEKSAKVTNRSNTNRVNDNKRNMRDNNKTYKRKK